MAIFRGPVMRARVRALTAASAAGVVATAAWAAPAAAPAAPPAAEPTRQELLEQIQSLRAKVERLEAAQPPDAAPAPQPPKRAGDRTGNLPDDLTDDHTAVEQVTHDAWSRSQFLQTSGNFTAGYSKGKFLIQDDKGNNVLHPQLQFMPRFVANDREDAKHKSTDADFQSGFELRRMKLGFDGNVFTPDLTYLFLWATDRNSGNLVLEEAWAKYAFQSGGLKNFYVKGGQFKDPFAHESLTSSKKLLAAERTLINDLFTGGDNFVQGMSVGWDDGPKGSPLRMELAYTDGANAINQNFQDFPSTKANFGVAGRVEYLAMGKWSEYEDFTTVDNTENMLVFGAGIDFTEAGNNDTLLHTVDVQFETKRLSLYGAYLGRAVEDLPFGTGASAGDVNAYDWGFIAQAAYMVNRRAEPFLRYDYIHFDRRSLAASSLENDVHEITAGLNYYYKSHAAKLTADVTYLPNGTPIADTGADILTSNDEAEFVVRAQFQLLL